MSRDCSQSFRAIRQGCEGKGIQSPVSDVEGLLPNKDVKGRGYSHLLAMSRDCSQSFRAIRQGCEGKVIQSPVSDVEGLLPILQGHKTRM